MRATIRKIGNSRGIIIPASLLAACGIGQEVDLRLDGEALVLEKPTRPRQGWFGQGSMTTDKGQTVPRADPADAEATAWAVAETVDWESGSGDWEW